MKWLNYHHLYYFRTIAAEGSIARAATLLRLGQPTLSTQLKQLEDSLGQALFERRNRALHLTEAGKVVLDYANEIFRLGSELLQVLEDKTFATHVQFQLGVIDSVPKTLVAKVVEKIIKTHSCTVTILEGKSEELFRDLFQHKLDLVISDFSPGTSAKQKVYAKSLIKLPIAVYGHSAKFKNLKKDFPKSLSDQPFVMPTPNTKLRHDIEHYFKSSGIQAKVVAECQDTSVQKILGSDGVGLIPIPDFASNPLVQDDHLSLIGTLPHTKAEYFVISAARRIENPVAADIFKKLDLENH